MENVLCNMGLQSINAMNGHVRVATGTIVCVYSHELPRFESSRESRIDDSTTFCQGFAIRHDGKKVSARGLAADTRTCHVSELGDRSESLQSKTSL
jgi:hypothetical protein